MKVLFPLFLLLFLLLPFKHGSAAESQSDLNPIKDGTWEAADRGLKNAFLTDYKAAGDNDRPVYQKHLPLLGVKAILDYLETTNEMCHGVAHNLGKELYAQTKDVMDSLRACGNRCTNACMHGVIGEALGGHGHDKLAPHMEEFCASKEMSIHKPGNCAHAMGHALMLKSEDLDESLKDCQSFSSPAMQYYCATGVYMQYTDWLMSGSIRTTRPTFLYPCDRKNTLFPAACYRYLMSYLKQECNGDIGQMTQICRDMEEGPQRWGCFHGLGKANTRRTGREPGLLPEICSQGSSVDQAMCIEGIIEKLVELDEAAAKNACDNLTGENAGVCNDALREGMYRTDKPTMLYYLPQK